MSPAAAGRHRPSERPVLVCASAQTPWVSGSTLTSGVLFPLSSLRTCVVRGAAGVTELRGWSRLRSRLTEISWLTSAPA